MGRRRFLFRCCAQESVIFQIRNSEFGMRNYGVAAERRHRNPVQRNGLTDPGFRIVFKETSYEKSIDKSAKN